MRLVIDWFLNTHKKRQDKTRMEDLVPGEETKKKSDKMTSSQSLPNLAFIDTNEQVMNELHCNINDDAIRIQSNNEAMFWGCYHCQVHHQDWPQMHPAADNLMVKFQNQTIMMHLSRHWPN